MERKYILFHTGKAALFLFYSLVMLLLFLFYAKLTQEIPQANLVGGSILYVAIMAFYAISIDRRLHGNRNR
jgi:membrane associated rhomboid family serine protease